MKLIDLPIQEARQAKWEIGRIKYGGIFQGDPLEHLDQELLDAQNYAEEAQRQGYDMRSIPDRLFELCRDLRELRKEQLCTRMQTSVSHGA